MKIKYIDLIEQSFDWPQDEFEWSNDSLSFHGIPMVELAERYGTPLKFTYLPKIGENIRAMKEMVERCRQKIGYEGQYHYCYVTKANHFAHVVRAALSEQVHLETSSAFDIDLIRALHAEQSITIDQTIICNGVKTQGYTDKISELMRLGFSNVIPVIDSFQEIDRLRESATHPIHLGIRIATEEEPKCEFYTSRLGVRYKHIPEFYMESIAPFEKVKLRMLHFFVNTGITDTAYYWNELAKCLAVYCEMAKLCPTLDSLNIGGGFPAKNSLGFEFDYEYMIEQILTQIKLTCDSEGVKVPDIYTEFGSYTVGESGGAVYKVQFQKQQNDREKWNIIDSSFMTTLPDTWAINKRFIVLPLNRWEDPYERVFLGGITCDSDDYYNSEQHLGAIFMPTWDDNKPIYIGFFNTGAYQESLGGFGGVHHCLIPQPKQILIDRDEHGGLTYTLFSDEQQAPDMLKLLGYEDVGRNVAGPLPDLDSECMN